MLPPSTGFLLKIEPACFSEKFIAIYKSTGDTYQKIVLFSCKGFLVNILLSVLFPHSCFMSRLSRTSWFSSSYSIFPRSILISSPRIHLGLPSNLFPWGFLTKILYESYSYPFMFYLTCACWFNCLYSCVKKYNWTHLKLKQISATVIFK
jgi:hypothetical protein